MPATIKALSDLDRSYGNFKRVIYSLGCNDYFHREKHHFEERAKAYTALQQHTARVFPKATIHLVVPYEGMKDLDKTEIAEQIKIVKQSCRKVKVHIPPSLKNRVKGVHPDDDGKIILTNFYQQRFFPNKPRAFSSNSGKRRPDVEYARAHISGPHASASAPTAGTYTGADFPPYSGENRGNFRVPVQQSPPPMQQQSHPVQLAPQRLPTPPQGNSRQDQMVLDIADALAHMLSLRRSEPTYSDNRPWR